MFAEREAHRLQRALQLAERDAGLLEEGQLEGDVVGDDADAVEEIEDASAGAVEIDDEDAIAAVIDLQQPDAGAVRVEAGRLGVFDLDGETLPRAASAAISAAGALSFARLERAGRLRLGRASSARRSTSVLFGAVSMSIATQSAPSSSPRRRRACASSAT